MCIKPLKVGSFLKAKSQDGVQESNCQHTDLDSLTKYVCMYTCNTWLCYPVIKKIVVTSETLDYIHV